MTDFASKAVVSGPEMKKRFLAAYSSVSGMLYRLCSLYVNIYISIYWKVY